MGSVNEFLYQKLARFVAVFWFSISTYLLPLFGLICTYFLRLSRNDTSLKYNSRSLELNYEKNDEFDSNYVMEKPENGSKEDVIDYKDAERDGLSEKDPSELCLQFKFPTFEEFVKSKKDNGDVVSLEATTNTIKYEFTSEKSFSAFIEELEPTSFQVKEVNTEINGGSFGDGEIDNKEESLSHKDFNSLHSESQSINEENSIITGRGEGFNEKNDVMTSEGEEGKTIGEENSLHVHNEKESSMMDSESESISSSNLQSVFSCLVDSYTDGFLSEGDFEGEDHLMDINGEKEMSDSDASQESDDFDDEDSGVMEELRNLEEEDHLLNSNNFKSDVVPDKEESVDYKYGESSGKDDNPEIPELNNASVLDSEDTNKLETLWEHQDLVEQLKMELKKVRATGLPTIFEESESPKLMEDLKPWKIDEKFQHENPMGELHKFYKSYRERMRKFDILTYQKMYAIGFLQLKDPLQSISTEKTSFPDIRSIFSENFYLYKSKNYETDPTKKFINEMQSDLEVVYVGQMCLSWEFLHWQYGMALELWESDPRGIRLYNEVAGEFQQFQVLVQRFIEDEPFQGPRIQNYIRQRCVLRNLLQVPVIREDISKDRKKERRRVRDDYSITSDLLVEIVEESIRIFWHFVRADKDSTNVKSQKGLGVELQDPADSETLKEVKKDLQKKERKLKEQLRSGNCILRRFQKYREDDEADQVLFFFSQVDMKLVSRVLNMSRLTTDQLVWCRNKLNTVSFMNRKIYVEPSFCLFPC